MDLYLRKALKLIAKEEAHTREIEFTCLFLRLIGDALSSLTQCHESACYIDNMKSLLDDTKPKLIELLCKASESKESMILNQVQHIFHFVIQIILDEKIAFDWREELDLLYSKIVLKPAFLAETQVQDNED
jgi:hypothetical protein